MDPVVADLKTNWLIHFKKLKAVSCKRRSKILANATEEGLLSKLFLLARNLYYNKVHLTPREKTRLLCYKKQIKSLAGARITSSGRRRLFLKHEKCGDRGLLTALLTPFVRILSRLNDGENQKGCGGA